MFFSSGAVSGFCFIHRTSIFFPLFLPVPLIFFHISFLNPTLNHMGNLDPCEDSASVEEKYHQQQFYSSGIVFLYCHFLDPIPIFISIGLTNGDLDDCHLSCVHSMYSFIQDTFTELLDANNYVRRLYPESEIII